VTLFDMRIGDLQRLWRHFRDIVIIFVLPIWHRQWSN